jgi:tetratricopeptide (TPR) repeat protein
VKAFDRHRHALVAAARARQAGDAPEAIDRLAPVLEIEPDHVPANAEMARALRLLGDPLEAEGYYRVALDGVLEYSLVVELAECLAEQLRFDEAEILLDAALEIAEGDQRRDPGEALCVRAAIALAQQRPEDAQVALDLVVPKRASKRTKQLRDRLSADASIANATS